MSTSLDQRPRANASPQRSAKELWVSLSRGPMFNEFVDLLRTQHAALQNIYETQPASEFNRGKVLALRGVISFLQSGDTQ